MSIELESPSWNMTFKTTDDAKLLTTHIEDYSKLAHTCLERVSRLWNEIGLSRGDRQHEFDEVTTAVHNVWSATIDRAERKKRERQREIDDAVSTIYKIKEELGDCTRDSRKQGIEGLVKLEVIVGSSLQTRYEVIQELLRDWGAQRNQREGEFKALQNEIHNLRLRFGEVVIADASSLCKLDVSLTNLQILSEELEQCKAEKLRRERQLAALLSKLRFECVPLGENDVEIAASAHPSLKFYREALPGHFSLVRPSFSNQPGLQRNIRPEDVELDLSDYTFASLEEKILEVHDLRAVREKQATEVASALKYLWDLLAIPEDDLERGMLMRCLEGPTRLQLQSIEKCRTEISQLETTWSDQLWTLIYRAKKELEDICDETMLPMPQLCPLLTINDNEDSNNKPVGKLSDALTKLKKMIVETRELSEKRAPIIQQITQIQNARSEVEWLAEYELDADRYKGRDLSKKLDRALKAGRIRDKFPDMIKRLKKNLSKWEQDEGAPFVYQGQEYNATLEDMVLSLDKKQSSSSTGKPYRLRNVRRPHSRASGLTPPPIVKSPRPNADGKFSSSGGPTIDASLGSRGLPASVFNTKESQKTPPSSSFANVQQHPSDGEKSPSSNGRRALASPMRRSRGRASRSYDSIQSLDSSFQKSTGHSPHYIWGHEGSSSNQSSKALQRDEAVDSGRRLKKTNTTLDRYVHRSADLSDLHPSLDSFLDSNSLLEVDDQQSNPFTAPRSYKRNVVGKDRRLGISSPIPNRGMRCSLGDSRSSGALSETDVKSTKQS